MVTRREWLWAGTFAAGVMALTTAPYVVAAASEANGWRFGGFLLAVEDGNSYIAKMAEGARGAWLFTLTYSSEPQRGAFMFGLHLLLGRLAGPQHDAQVVVYHLARILFGFALLLVSYLFLAEFLPRVRQRRLGLVLVALGGGLGWLLIPVGGQNLLGSLPLDFFSPEAYTFLTLYALPHLALARCLLLLGLLAYLRGKGGLAGLALFGVSLVQPLYVLVAWVILGMDLLLSWLITWRHVSRITRHSPPSTLHPPRLSPLTLLTIVVLSSPIVLYTIYVFSVDPVLKQWNAQNVLPSPHPLHYLLGYATLLAPGVVGVWALWRRQPILARFITGWALAVPALLYAPLTTQRRLIEGFQLPLVILALWGLTVVWRRFRWWTLPTLFSLTFTTTLLILAGGVNFARLRQEPIFHPPDQLAAFEWLAQHAEPGQVALSSFETGNALPAYTPLIAYIGHGPESVFLAQKKPRVAAFYQSATADAARLSLLADGRIAFVIFGPHERALGDFNPESVDYLHREFLFGDYSIYKVVASTPSTKSVTTDYADDPTEKRAIQPQSTQRAQSFPRKFPKGLSVSASFALFAVKKAFCSRVTDYADF